MIFVDSSFWIAHEGTRDDHHAEARALERRHGRGRLLTSTAVVAETRTSSVGERGRVPTMSWLDRVLRATDVRVERIDEPLGAAWAWLRVDDERPTRSSTRRASP